jgi:hypothetical protein
MMESLHACMFVSMFYISMLAIKTNKHVSIFTCKDERFVSRLCPISSPKQPMRSKINPLTLQGGVE